MATFSYDLKIELCKQKCEDLTSALSLLSGIIKTCGEIRLQNRSWVIVISTEIKELYDKVNELLKLLYSTTATINEDSENVFNRNRFEIVFPINLSEKILVDTEVMFYDEDKDLCLSDGISRYMVEETEQMRAYLKGATLGCFTSNITINEEKLAKTNGYHIEYVFSSDKLAQDFSELLSQYDIISKKVERKNSFVVYVKDFEQICYLLEILQVPVSYLALKNENTMREVRNQVNRQNNCIIGNSTKTVNASVKQLEAIKIIENSIGIEKLEEPLQQVCYLRIANPEESLDNLVKLSFNKITKSGLYHRFQKLIKIADELK